MCPFGTVATPLTSFRPDAVRTAGESCANSGRQSGKERGEGGLMSGKTQSHSAFPFTCISSIAIAGILPVLSSCMFPYAQCVLFLYFLLFMQMNGCVQLHRSLYTLINAVQVNFTHGSKGRLFFLFCGQKSHNVMSINTTQHAYLC